MKKLFNICELTALIGYLIMSRIMYLADRLGHLEGDIYISLFHLMIPCTLLLGAACIIHSRLPRQEKETLSVSSLFPIHFRVYHPYYLLAHMGLLNLCGLVAVYAADYAAVAVILTLIVLLGIDIAAVIIVYRRKKREKALAKEKWRQLHGKKRRRKK